MYENGLVIKYYGIPAFFVVVFILVAFVHFLTKRGAVLNPLAALENAIFGNGPLMNAALQLLAQLLKTKKT